MHPWADWCTEVITIEPWASQNAYGEASYGDPVVYRARVTGEMKRVIDARGEECIATVTVYVVDSTGITARDRLTLPTGWSPQQPRILAVRRIPDERGRMWETLFCG